jgi:ribosome maturation factor RimP
VGAQRPFFVKGAGLADVHTKERQLAREISDRVERGIPGTEVLAVELTGPERMCVYIDHPQGVDLALCERVSRLLDSYTREYGLDVSSPGIQRPLRTPAHFARVVGKRVALRTAPPIDGRRNFRGELVDADEREVKLQAGPDEPVAIPYELIVRGNLIDEG